MNLTLANDTHDIQKLSQFKQSSTALQTQEEVGYMRSLSRVRISAFCGLIALRTADLICYTMVRQVDEAFEGVVGRVCSIGPSYLPWLYSR